MLATFLLCLACSSRRIAREVGLHISTKLKSKPEHLEKQERHQRYLWHLHHSLSGESHLDDPAPGAHQR
jgi:hypothetical protein